MNGLTMKRWSVVAAWAAVVAAVSGCGPMPSGPAMPTMGNSAKPPVVDVERARIDATSRLMQAAEAAKPATRIHAIEAIAQVMPDRAGSVVMQGLRDEDPDVRAAAATAAGELQLALAKERLEEMAMFGTGERDKAAYCSVLGALHRLGDKRRSTEFKALLDDPTELVRGQAAAGVALTGDPRAIAMLKRRLEVEAAPLIKIQLIEAAAKLGDAVAVRKLEGHASLPTDSGIIALEAVARLGTPGAMDLLRVIATKKDQAPLRKAVAFGGLARLGEVGDESFGFCLLALEKPAGVLNRAYGPHHIRVEPEEIGRLQRCAAISLGWMRRREAVGPLQAVMASASDPETRVAAAMSILRIVRPGRAPVVVPAPASRAAEPAARKQPRRPSVQSAGGKD